MIAIAKASDTEREVLFGNAADRVRKSLKILWFCVENGTFFACIPFKNLL